jgi:hypothetical protein
MATILDESPRSKYIRALGNTRAEQGGAMDLAVVNNRAGMQQEGLRQAGGDLRAVRSQYAKAMADKDKQDYDAAYTTWQNFGKATGKQQEEFKQKTEAYESVKKLFKRQGLPVFDDAGEVMFPPSEVDAKAETDMKVKEAGFRVIEELKRNRKPNEQDLTISLGAAANAYRAAEESGDEQTMKSTKAYLAHVSKRIGDVSGMQKEDDNDPLGLLNLQER